MGIFHCSLQGCTVESFMNRMRTRVDKLDRDASLAALSKAFASPQTASSGALLVTESVFTSKFVTLYGDARSNNSVRASPQPQSQQGGDCALM
jgi:hypothetical protein